MSILSCLAGFKYYPAHFAEHITNNSLKSLTKLPKTILGLLPGLAHCLKLFTEKAQIQKFLPN